MGQPFLGEVRMAGFNFTPQGFLPCDGSLQPIAENEALFNLIGTTYGGDGQTTFGLPNLKSRVVIHQGTGTDGITYPLGQMVGAESVPLNSQQMGPHTHPFQGANAPAGTPGPGNAYPGQIGVGFYSTDTNPSNLVQMASNSTNASGGNQPHNNIMPYLCVNFIIAAEGIYPTQS